MRIEIVGIRQRCGVRNERLEEVLNENRRVQLLMKSIRVGKRDENRR